MTLSTYDRTRGEEIHLQNGDKYVVYKQGVVEYTKMIRNTGLADRGNHEDKGNYPLQDPGRGGVKRGRTQGQQRRERVRNMSLRVQGVRWWPRNDIRVVR
jgi:hypothetical protein